jgi:hypothetical protein
VSEKAEEVYSRRKVGRIRSGLAAGRRLKGHCSNFLFTLTRFDSLPSANPSILPTNQMDRGQKRKRGDDHSFDDESDDDMALPRQILPVANLAEDFDGEPVDGLEYLFTVRRDARKLPRITRVPNPYGLPEPVEVENFEPPSSSSVLPCSEWRQSFVFHFKNLRRNLRQPTIHVTAPPLQQKQKLLPEKKQREQWWAFLEGKLESDWNPPKAPKKDSRQMNSFGKGMRGFQDADDTDQFMDLPYDNAPRETWQFDDKGQLEKTCTADLSESLPTPSGTPLSEIPSASSSLDQPFMSNTLLTDALPSRPSRKPTPTLLQHIDHKYSLHLIMYFTHWINCYLQQKPSSSCPTEVHAQWIFSLLTKLDDLLSADDMNLLRHLARACIAYLQKISLEENRDHDSDHSLSMTKRSCWIIITAVADVWVQSDLWMDVESALASSAKA